jgi:phage terminase small subunit
MAKNLTAKEALFVHSYMQSGNATRAAKVTHREYIAGGAADKRRGR